MESERNLAHIWHLLIYPIQVKGRVEIPLPQPEPEPILAAQIAPPENPEPDLEGGLAACGSFISRLR